MLYQMTRSHCDTHLVGMSPVSTTTHVAASSSSVHVPPVHWTASVHGPSSVPHVAPHWAAPGGSTQTRNGATTPVKVSAVGESSSEGRGRQKATRWAVEATTRPRGCGQRGKRQVSINKSLWRSSTEPCILHNTQSFLWLHSFLENQAHLLWSCLCSGSLHVHHFSVRVHCYAQTGSCPHAHHCAGLRLVWVSCSPGWAFSQQAQLSCFPLYTVPGAWQPPPSAAQHRWPHRSSRPPQAERRSL